MDISLETLKRLTENALEQKRKKKEESKDIEKQTALWIAKELPQIQKNILAHAKDGESFIEFICPIYITISMIQSHFPGLVIEDYGSEDDTRHSDYEYHSDYDSDDEKPEYLKTHKVVIRWRW